ncbi:hypothetical protein MNBD_CHLOROFLEXI01-3562, partial [hydrothermal vent metagenome]
MDKIKTIIDKEWAEVFKNKLVLFSVAFLPLLLTVMPLIILATTQSLTPEELASGGAGTPDEFFGDLCIGLSEADCAQVFLLNIFTLMFMILPIMIPVTIAAYSIVGEKSTRSLEPLLATPITTAELIIGKAVAAVVPAVLATWVAFSVYLLGVRLMTNAAIFAKLVAPMWLLAVFLVGPLLAVLSVC